jgi:hypothetical protein
MWNLETVLIHLLNQQNVVFTRSGEIWARVIPERIRSRHYPVISAGKLNLRQLNTFSY